MSILIWESPPDSEITNPLPNAIMHDEGRLSSRSRQKIPSGEIEQPYIYCPKRESPLTKEVIRVGERS